MQLLHIFRKLFMYSSIVFLLQGCHSGDEQTTSGAPRTVGNIDSSFYDGLLLNTSSRPLFEGAGITSSEQIPCNVKVHRITYNTIGGAGESTTSSGVFMHPTGNNDGCTGQDL